MLVVGSRGIGGFRGLVMGSTAGQVVGHASCPVVVVPVDVALDGQPTELDAGLAKTHRLRPTASGLVEEPVEHPGAELQRVGGHPLVDAVEQRGEVQVAGQPQRREAEAADPELVPVLGVGAAGHQVRRHQRVGVLGQQRAASSRRPGRRRRSSRGRPAC